MRPMDDFRLKYFERLEKILSKKKDFRKAFINHVKSINSSANCMFCLSFLCCCCCSVLGHSSLILADFGRHWVNSLNIYEQINSNKVRNIFIKAMIILRKIKKKVEEKNQNNKRQVQEALHTETVAIYDTIKYNQISYEFGELHHDMWMYKLFNEIYNPSLQHNHYSLSSEETQILFMALPLFYPATVKEMKWAFKFDEKIAVIIKDLLQKL